MLVLGGEFLLPAPRPIARRFTHTEPDCWVYGYTTKAGTGKNRRALMHSLDIITNTSQHITNTSPTHHQQRHSLGPFEDGGRNAIRKQFKLKRIQGRASVSEHPSAHPPGCLQIAEQTRPPCPRVPAGC
jgi:hypothetical protein